MAALGGKVTFPLLEFAETGGVGMRVFKRFVVAIAAAASFSVSAYGQSKPTDLEMAKELLKAGKADQSLALVDPIIAQALSNTAKDPKAICPAAAAAVLQTFMKGDFSVSVENDWCDAMLVKGYALNELKRPAQAAQVLETLVGHAPDNPQYFVEYAYAVRASGQLERSLDLYKKAERIASRFEDKQSAAHWRAAALRGQGYAYTDLQQWDDAVKAYQRSFKYEPDSELARNELKYIEEHRPH
jgi:tetratricopeptide (TPR) repeat protein